MNKICLMIHWIFMQFMKFKGWPCTRQAEWKGWILKVKYQEPPWNIQQSIIFINLYVHMKLKFWNLVTMIMLTVSLVIATWCVLRLQMEKTTTRCREYLWIYQISSHRQLAVGSGPLVGGLGNGVLTSLHHKSKLECYERLHMSMDFSRFFGTT